MEDVKKYLNLPYNYIIHPVNDESGSYFYARILELDGCQSTGETYEQKNIKKLITLTPVVITKLEGGYDIENDLEFVKERILSNTQKKYKNIYETEAKVDFIKNITKTNKKPIKVPYKNKSVLGNKFEIEIKEDPMSQNLAFLVLAVGCGEKNSNLGFGMCMAR